MATPHSKILIHQVSAGQGQATDIEIQARETLSMKRLLEEIIARHEAGSREGRQGYGARLLHDRAGSSGLRHHRHCDRATGHAEDGGGVLVSRAISRYKVERHGPSDRR